MTEKLECNESRLFKIFDYVPFTAFVLGGLAVAVHFIYCTTWNVSCMGFFP